MSESTPFERFKRMSGLQADREPSTSPGQPVQLPDDEATVEKALKVLARLKSYTLPAGRMPAAGGIAERCAAGLLHWEDGEPVWEADGPASILAVLDEIEGELIVLGGAPDPVIEAVAMVQRAFLGARLVEVRTKTAREIIEP
jgi:hypothetical protein